MRVRERERERERDAFRNLMYSYVLCHGFFSCEERSFSLCKIYLNYVPFQHPTPTSLSLTNPNNHAWVWSTHWKQNEPSSHLYLWTPTSHLLPQIVSRYSCLSTIWWRWETKLSTRERKKFVTHETCGELSPLFHLVQLGNFILDSVWSRPNHILC